MPLLDHFRPPVDPRVPWESFHGVWASDILGWLNAHLPTRYYSLMHTHTSSRIEADVAEYEFDHPNEEPTNGSVATAVQTAVTPVATQTMTAVFPDDLEVRVFDSRDGATLVAVIELISPANLDRPETRTAFAAKCAAYLQRGLGLIILDVVTTHHFNLHNSLIDLLGHPASFEMPDDAILYTVGYVPARRNESNLIDFWPVRMAVGGTFSVMPLALRGGPRVHLDLEATYTAARQRSRV